MQKRREQNKKDTTVQNVCQICAKKGENKTTRAQLYKMCVKKSQNCAKRGENKTSRAQLYKISAKIVQKRRTE